MLEHFGDTSPAWIVADGDEADYEREGATVIGAERLPQARNLAIETAHALGSPSVQLSDDLNKLERLDSDKQASEITVQETASLLHDRAVAVGAKLAGVSPTSNPYWFSPERPVKTKHFIVGDLMVILPSPQRFDEDLHLKEDYDFTARHISAHGVVARCDFIMAHFSHRSNSGGAVSYRTAELEQQAIEKLIDRWGRVVIRNKRRENEVLFRGWLMDSSQKEV